MLLSILKIIHLLALSVWSGAVVFFSFFVALPVIDSMKKLAQTKNNWLHLSTEQHGTQLAGEFLNVVYARYFPFECVCGVVALATSLWWWNTPSWSAKLRIIVVAAGLGCAALNLFVLAPRVHELRTDRYSSDVQVAEKANAAFGPAHTASLLVDLVGLLCVIVALILVLWIPRD